MRLKRCAMLFNKNMNETPEREKMKNLVILKPIMETSETETQVTEQMELEIKRGAIVQSIIQTDLEIVVLGIPFDDEDSDEDERHNCDFMGCGQCHVLARMSNYRTEPLNSEPVGGDLIAWLKSETFGADSVADLSHDFVEKLKGRLENL
jgi:hypothetical protein